MDLNKIEVERDPVIIFMGTPIFSAFVLEGLIKKYKIRAVVTRPDKPKGRNLEVMPSPIKEVALKHNILCLQPVKIKDALQEINVLEPDLIITCAYGQILPLELLLIPKLGCINVHASLLPKLRGGAPIQHAIIDGYSKTGVTIMYMVERMDAGDIISQKEVVIDKEDTGSSLHDKLMVVSRDLLLETLPSILNGTNERIKQNEDEATYGFVIKKEDEKVDFTRTKRDIVNQVRGLNAFPGAYCYFDDKRLKIWSCYRTENLVEAMPGQITAIYSDGFGVKVGNGEIVVTEVQPEGGKKMSALSYVNGRQNFVGKMLR